MPLLKTLRQEENSLQIKFNTKLTSLKMGDLPIMKTPCLNEGGGGLAQSEKKDLWSIVNEVFLVFKFNLKSLRRPIKRC